MKKTTVIAATVIAVSLLAGCGTDDETQACLDQLQATLDEAGADRTPTAEERAACADPDQRAFIMGD